MTAQGLIQWELHKYSLLFGYDITIYGNGYNITIYGKAGVVFV